MIKIKSSEVRKQWSEVLSAVEFKGETIAIQRNNRIVGVLVPMPPENLRDDSK